MGSAAVGVTLAFTDAAGSAQKVSLNQANTFTQLGEADIVNAGAASQAVTAGVAASILAALVAVQSGIYTVKLDGEATGHTVNPGGFLVVSGGGATELRVATAAGGKCAVKVFG